MKSAPFWHSPSLLAATLGTPQDQTGQNIPYFFYYPGKIRAMEMICSIHFPHSLGAISVRPAVLTWTQEVGLEGPA